MLRRIFEPLGYVVTEQSYRLDDRFEAWGVGGPIDWLRAVSSGVRAGDF